MQRFLIRFSLRFSESAVLRPFEPAVLHFFDLFCYVEKPVIDSLKHSIDVILCCDVMLHDMIRLIGHGQRESLFHHAFCASNQLLKGRMLCSFSMLEARDLAFFPLYYRKTLRSSSSPLDKAKRL